ncbi:MAG: hypothetical protein U0736_26265 [Gemmataceae bacterium]
MIGTASADVLTDNLLNNQARGGLGDDVYRFNADGFQGSDTIVDAGGVDTLDFCQRPSAWPSTWRWPTSRST